MQNCEGAEAHRQPHRALILLATAFPLVVLGWQ